jgi:hypothetical protein
VSEPYLGLHLVSRRDRGLRLAQRGSHYPAGLSLDSRLESRGRKHSYSPLSACSLYSPCNHLITLTEEKSSGHVSPPRNLPLGNRIVPHTLHTRLLTTSTRRQPLITPILPQPAAVTRTHVPEAAALSSLAPTSTCNRTPYDLDLLHAARTLRFYSASAAVGRGMSGALMRMTTAARRRGCR